MQYAISVVPLFLFHTVGAESLVTCSSLQFPRSLQLRYFGYRCGSRMPLFAVNAISVHLSPRDFDRG
jgi:hypothetical protein